MNMDILGFFQEHMDALPLYEAFEENLLQTVENVRIKVQKSQISFYNRHLFACVSFLRVRKKKACPPRFLVITLGPGPSAFLPSGGRCHVAIPGPLDAPHSHQ